MDARRGCTSTTKDLAAKPNARDVEQRIGGGEETGTLTDDVNSSNGDPTGASRNLLGVFTTDGDTKRIAEESGPYIYELTKLL